MHVKFPTNKKYGRTARGGRKNVVDAPKSKGHMGIPPAGNYPRKSSVKAGMDVPNQKGNKGITLAKGFKSRKAPLD